MSKYNDLTGNKYGRLTCIEFVGRNKQYDSLWKCMCDCGTEIIVRAGVLKNGHTQSCGCLQKQRTAEAKTTHGLYYENGSRSKLYHVWGGMKERCYNPNHEGYKYYGARGITICNEWLNYEIFHEWAINNGYKDGMSIERERLNGIYDPGNCSWILLADQAKNRSMCVTVEYNGEKKTLSAWAELIGKSSKQLAQRIRRGWPIEKAFTK